MPDSTNEEITLRDVLAKDRTVLANERTLLAYIRTGFGFAVAGATLLKLFPDEIDSQVIASILLVAGVLVTAIGLVRFRQIQKRLKSMVTAS